MGQLSTNQLDTGAAVNKQERCSLSAVAFTCWALLLRWPGSSVCSTWIRMYSWLVGCTVPRAKGPPTCSFSKALSRKSVKFMAVQHWSSRENRCDRHLTTKVYSSNLNTCTMLYSRIQKLSVEDTANILQGLSRSGYMLKKSWTQQSTC